MLTKQYSLGPSSSLLKTFLNIQYNIWPHGLIVAVDDKLIQFKQANFLLARHLKKNQIYGVFLNTFIKHMTNIFFSYNFFSSSRSV